MPCHTSDTEDARRLELWYASSCVKNINKSKKEYEANLFAAELLLDLNENEQAYISGYSINQLASCYKVPTELVELKFKIKSFL